MAVGVENLITLDGLIGVRDESQQIILEIEKQIQSLVGTNNTLDATIKRLEDYLVSIYKQEQYIKDTFGVKSIQELQKNFINFYNKSGLNNFTGTNLNTKVIETFIRHTDKSKKDFYNKLTKIEREVNAAIPRVINNSLNSEQAQKAIFDVALAIFNSEFGTGARSGKYAVRSTKGFNFDFDKGIFTMIGRDLSEVEKKIIMKHKIEDFNINFEVEGNSVYNTFDIYNILADGGSKAMTPTEAKEYEKAHPGFINKANQEIISFIKSNINNDYQNNAERIIKYMLAKDNTMFFSGNSATEVIGIFGEISAYITIMNLIPNANLADIEWVANQTKDGKKLSVDFYLDKILGIQVKNTIRDYSWTQGFDIGFVDKNASSVLKQLQNKYDMNFTELESLLLSHTFNVPYKRKGRRYEKVGYNTTFTGDDYRFSEFVEVKKDTENLISILNTIFTAFAPDFLFMSGGRDFENQLANIEQNLEEGKTGNNLYIVAGKPFFVSTILNQIIKNLRTLKSDSEKLFKVEASIGNVILKSKSTAVAGNIIAYKNANASKKEQIKNMSTKMKSSFFFS